MSTLAEIEEAVDTLPPLEQEALLHRLTNKLKLARKQSASNGWPVPPPDVPKEELERIEAIIEAEFPILPAKN
jgi:hypothetical protein